MGKRRLSFADDSAAGFDDFLLAVFISRILFQVNFSREQTRKYTRRHFKPQICTDNHG